MINRWCEHAQAFTLVNIERFDPVQQTYQKIPAVRWSCASCRQDDYQDLAMVRLSAGLGPDEDVTPHLRKVQAYRNARRRP